MKIGDKVKKVVGTYRFIGIIVSVFATLEGEARVVAQNQDGILHIFSPSNLEIITEEE